jgi:hypothetical protein
MHALPDRLPRLCQQRMTAQEEEDEFNEYQLAPMARIVRLERKFAKAIFRSGLSLISIDDDSWKALSQDIAQFKPSLRARLADDLLEVVYEEVKEEVNELISHQGSGGF